MKNTMRLEAILKYNNARTSQIRDMDLGNTDSVRMACPLYALVYSTALRHYMTPSLQILSLDLSVIGKLMSQKPTDTEESRPSYPSY